MSIFAKIKAAAATAGAWLLRQAEAVGGYIFKVLVAIDQLACNVLPGPLLNGLVSLECALRGIDRATVAKFGFPDETLSSVIGKNRRSISWCGWLAVPLNWIDKNHVEDAALADGDEGRNFRS